MYKLIAVDLDETLLNDNRELCQRNIDAIQKAREKGVKIVPASGRTPGMLKDLYTQLDIDSDEEYSLLGNGAILITNKSSTILDCQGLDYEKAKSLFYWGKEQGYGIEVFTPHQVMFFYVDEEEKELARNIGNIDIMPDDAEFPDLQKETILKLMYLIRDEEERAALLAHLREKHEGELAISASSNRYLELNALGINKGNGLKKLAEILSIDISEVMAIGDNTNDVEMIDAAGLGVAVQNANAEVKAVADVITDADNNEGAVAEAIERFVL